MQKRGWMPVRLSSLGVAILLALPFVSAAPNPLSSVGDMVQRFLGPILLSWGGGAFEFWAKVLVWILIFAILFAVTHLVPAIKDSRNIRITISAVLALISVLPLRTPILRALFETYGVVFMTLLIFLPIGGMIFLTHKIPSGKTRLVYAIRAILFYVLAAVIQNVVTGIQQQAFATSPALGDVGNFAVAVCGLLFLYNVIMTLFGGPDETPHQQAAEGASNLWDWFRDTVTPETPPTTPPGTPYPDHLVAHIEQLCTTINQFHNLIMDAHGYRWIGNLLLEAEERAFRHGDAAMFAAIPLRRTNFRNSATNARGLRMAIQQGIDRLLNDPNFAHLNRRHQRQWQRCYRRWVVAFFHYEHYNIRFLINYHAVAGRVAIP